MLPNHPTLNNSPPVPKQFCASVEEVEDNGDPSPILSRDNFVSLDFTGAQAVISGPPGINAFQRFKAEKEGRSEEMWAPYKSREEWQLARWLMLSGITQSNIDSFAKLPIIRENVDPSFKDKHTFFRMIDELPKVRGGWTCRELEVVGNIMQKGLDGEDVPMKEGLELWMRNPIDCVKELMEDPRFKDHMRYAPEKMFTSEDTNIRAIDEMWTADWWWETQVCINLWHIITHKLTV
ncbi:hypothetical protein BDP27DRAFT_1361830 [Rhodocollybia butyracea]|uniref:Uncharacterized protein n=1 Tax=Rhodocollybia butyracea TaxID=206335 RepID=A0A9P5PZS3_9AGAR|nr:hypothetical protein BDP27DRAFT_1361830 [Rhodocollybia butyracea]